MGNYTDFVFWSQVSLAFNIDGDNVHDDEPTIVRASAVDGSLEWDAVRGLRLWAAGGYVRCDKRTRDAAANGFAVGKFILTLVWATRMTTCFVLEAL